MFGSKAQKKNESQVKVTEESREVKNPYLHFHEDDPFPPSYRTRVTEDYGAWEDEVSGTLSSSTTLLPHLSTPSLAVP